MTMEYITSNKGGRKLAFEKNIYIKQKVLSNGTVWGDIMGGFCPGGFCPGGFCPRGDFVQGDFVRGILSGGFCPGGFCPRTETKGNQMYFSTKLTRMSRFDWSTCVVKNSVDLCLQCGSILMQ